MCEYNIFNLNWLQVIDRYPDIVDASANVHYYKIVLGERLDQPEVIVHEKEEQANTALTGAADTTAERESTTDIGEKDLTNVAAPLRKKQKLMTDFLKPPK